MIIYDYFVSWWHSTSLIYLHIFVFATLFIIIRKELWSPPYLSLLRSTSVHIQHPHCRCYHHASTLMLFVSVFFFFRLSFAIHQTHTQINRLVCIFSIVIYDDIHTHLHRFMLKLIVSSVVRLLCVLLWLLRQINISTDIVYGAMFQCDQKNIYYFNFCHETCIQ